jgi:hypothetical protein
MKNPLINYGKLKFGEILSLARKGEATAKKIIREQAEFLGVDYYSLMAEQSNSYQENGVRLSI